eukprot:m.356321 g.356321  ORF g.356321 m.356321 type:complete len:291 (-) comp17501_c0_seq1:383-1255(-)
MDIDISSEEGTPLLSTTSNGVAAQPSQSQHTDDATRNQTGDSQGTKTPPAESSSVSGVQAPDGVDVYIPAGGANQQQPAARKRLDRRFLSTRITHKLLLLTALWQLCSVIMLTVLDQSVKASDIGSHPLSDDAYLAGVVLLCIFQGIHLFMLVIVSYKLGKQMLHHTASGSFLAQSYMSTIFLFAGVYTLVHRLNGNAFRGLDESLSRVDKRDYAFLCFIKLLYFSTATMTSTGFGDIFSQAWYLDFIVTCQMVLSVLYTTSIFAKGINTFMGGATSPASQTQHSQARHI